MIAVDGKFFALEGKRFPVRGVTYGTFAPRDPDGARFPNPERLTADLEAMACAGFNVVRTYTSVPDDLLDCLPGVGLRLLAGVHWSDWRYLIGSSQREWTQVARTACAAVRAEARRLAGNPHVLAISVGNEIPADVVRWVGAAHISHLIEELADTAHAEDPDRLITYANFPSTEYLSTPGLDFALFNIFLDRPADLRRYLTRLHNLAGEQPLVIGELGFHAGTGDTAEVAQALSLDGQLAIAADRGVAGTCVFSWTDDWQVGETPIEGWQFGLTRADRSHRPALDVARSWNRKAVADLAPRGGWPSISVVICAYNAEKTLSECLRHTTALDYPGLEIIVVDDGSTDSTAAIAGRHPRARLLSVDHGGLSVARNAGLRAATSEIVAYLDADAYPTPEWPYYLALGFDSRLVAGVGGPNLAPRSSLGARRVAAAPGGPVHVLMSDDRAEHIPGCNMAFWREVLLEVGGFDPVYTAAGDDVDLCWRVLDRDWQIAFHPAAVVWHHRRPTALAYLRQQRGYGRAEALVAGRHPDRFTGLGAARWQGVIYGSAARWRYRDRIYRGAYAAAQFQSIYRGASTGMDLLHQLGVPVAALLVLTFCLGLLDPWLGLPAAVGLAFLASLALADMRAVPSAGREDRWFRPAVAGLHVLQPLARLWGRVAGAPQGSRSTQPKVHLAGPVRRYGKVRVVHSARPRTEIAEQIVEALRGSGVTVRSSRGWEEPDAVAAGSFLVAARLFTMGEPAGVVQMRAHRRLRPAGALAIVAVAAAWLIGPVMGLVVTVLVAAEGARGWWRTGPRMWRCLDRAEVDPSVSAGTPTAAAFPEAPDPSDPSTPPGSAEHFDQEWTQSAQVVVVEQ